MCAPLEIAVAVEREPHQLIVGQVFDLGNDKLIIRAVVIIAVGILKRSLQKPRSEGIETIRQRCHYRVHFASVITEAPIRGD